MAWIKLFNREVKLRPFVLSSTLRKIRGKWRDGKYTGRIVITGSVEITNGPKHAGPYRNHFVNSALAALVYILLSNFTNNNGVDYYNDTIEPLNPQTMYIGSDTSTKTTASMTALVAPIGTAPGTAPNSWNSTIQLLSNGSSATFTATWNAGTVSGTIGEMALYGSAATTYYTGYIASSVTWGSSNVMLSRLSVADGDFSSFTINSSYPLVIVWTIQFLFA